MAFCNVLKEERNKRGWTQEQLAHKLSVAPSTVGMWEQGSRIPSFEKMEEIADLFNINMDRLRGSSAKIENIAAHALHDLTEEEADEVLKFAEYIKSKRGK